MARLARWHARRRRYRAGDRAVAAIAQPAAASPPSPSHVSITLPSGIPVGGWQFFTHVVLRRWIIRTFGFPLYTLQSSFIPAAVLRMSCIYGERQMGTEDQGWVAWFTIAAVTNRQITIYGAGRQVRDVLYVDDLLDAYDAAIANIDAIKGRAVNLGGGPANVLAIRQVLELIAPRMGREISVAHSDWRPGDQRVFVADVSRARALLGWSPRTGVDIGVGRLYDWVVANQDLFR